ncbi:alpha-L-fucosidase [Ruficoccus amylovorans]|nr:alpha-L-fucosidase [Ruficoccus amylovorans]
MNKGDVRWFTQARFGLFIHWGLYSMPARHEWIRYKEEITDEDYRTYFDLFNPDLFQPEQWAELARRAGMKYVIITAKHHEGFCLWDSQYTDYKATNTVQRRDLLREIIDAFRRVGIRIGIYYSLIDWHHPDFTVDRIHPYREKVNWAVCNQVRHMPTYAQYMRDQVTELLTCYGDIDILWFDFSYNQQAGGKGRDDWESEKLVNHVRSLRPNIIIDNRLDLPGSGDIMTPEQYTPDEPIVGDDGKPTVWEGCQTFSGSWGYFRDETNWKSVKMCIEMLVRHVSCGGNLLLNVGPTSRGEIDPRATHALNGIAKWMHHHSQSIYGCGPAPIEFIVPPDCRYTWNFQTGKLYLHCFAWPFKHLHLRGMRGRVKYAQLMVDGSEIIRRTSDSQVHAHLSSATPEGAVTLELPTCLPFECEVPVIEITIT